MVFFTSESVTEGHPDKLADQISDGIVDAVLSQDPAGRMACETSVSTGLVLLTGEVSTSASVNYSQVARDIIARVGYTKSEFRLEAQAAAVLVIIPCFGVRSNELKRHSILACQESNASGFPVSI